jgi:glycosyltransferase involved in cell wall biosynthesis
MNPIVKKKPVLLQVLPALESGGVERGTIDIANAAANNGFQSLVVSAGGRMLKNNSSKLFTHIELPLNTKNYFSIKANSKKIEDIINEYDVDIVHARSRAPAWSAYWAAQNTGTKFITTFHGTYGLSGLGKKKYNSVMTKGNKIIAVSEFIARHIQDNYHTYSKNIEIIHRGIDLDIFNSENVNTARTLQILEQSRLPEDVPIILLPGRITEWKGQLQLIEAIKKIRHLKFYCILVGDDKRGGRYRKKLEHAIKKYHLSNMVRIMPNVSDMAALYKISDIVISASTHPEAFGRVSTEAQSMGRMLIATDHGGSKETVIHNDTGWLVEPRNPQAMADAIKHVLSITPMERAVIAENAIKNIRSNFSLEKMQDKTLQLYHSLLDD